MDVGGLVEEVDVGGLVEEVDVGGLVEDGKALVGGMVDVSTVVAGGPAVVGDEVGLLVEKQAVTIRSPASAVNRTRMRPPLHS